MNGIKLKIEGDLKFEEKPEKISYFHLITFLSTKTNKKVNTLKRKMLNSKYNWLSQYRMKTCFVEQNYPTFLPASYLSNILD